MISRNLTQSFAHCRSEHRRSVLPFTGRQRPLNSATFEDSVYIELEAGERFVKRAALPPLWTEVAEDAKSDIKCIRSKLIQLTNLQQTRLLKVFGDSTQEGKVIEAASLDIAKLIRHCEGRIYEIKNCTDQAKESEVDRNVQQNMQKNLATQLQQLSQAFRQAQKSYVEEMNGRQKSAAWEDDSGISSTCCTRFTDQQCVQLQELELSSIQRNDEIAEIASSVSELHAIFRELAVLVIDQGSMLDRIDYNIEMAVENTVKAHEQVKRTAKAQKSSRVNQCILTLVLVNASLILLLIWKTRS